jgi:hypothetical protein
MSTKRTIDFEHSAVDLNLNRKGKRQLKPKTRVPFHLYTDMQDDDGKESGTVYLEMRGVYFAASKNSVTVGIPPDVWNRIVTAGPVKVRKGYGPEFPQQKPKRK